MALRINTNVAALSAHKNMIKNDNELSNSLEKLSSGLRINKAADDASGMAIADSLRSQALGLGQAVRNANDGINMVQTADGALNESINIVNTIKTKSIQAAQDGQTTDSRKAIQADIDKLMAELDIIAKTTAFNGQKLLSGAFTDKKFQIGAYSGETVGISIGSSESTKTGHLTTAKLETNASNGGEVRISITSSIQDLEVEIQAVNLAYNNDAKNGMGALADAINKVANDTGVTAQVDVSVMSTNTVAAGTTGSDFAINGIAIGSITVQDADSNGALVNAINQKTDQHGVTASTDAAGYLSLTSNDGRAISVEGDTGTTLVGSNLSTFGSIKLFQIGANEIKISDQAETVSLSTTADVDVAATFTTTVDSTLTKNSVIGSESTIKAGSTLGFTLSGTHLKNSVTTTQDSTITAGSVLASGTSVASGSVLGGTSNLSATVTTSEDSYLKTGSIIASSSVLAEGTTVTTTFTSGGNTYAAGDTLASDLTIDDELTMTADMLLKSGTIFNSDSSVFNAGSYVGADIGLSGDTTNTVGMTMKAGSILVSSNDTKLQQGSTVGADINLNKNATVSTDTTIKAGSIIVSNSKLGKGSTIGGSVQISSADITLANDMTLAAGSILASGTLLKAGTVLTDSIRVSGGNYLEAGTVLSGDAITEGNNYLNNSMTLKKSSVLASLSTLAATQTSTSGGTATTALSDVEKFTLSDVDVTTQDGAQNAISIADSALRNLDKVRADLGSVQNQLNSTIANISVVRVNIFSAESTIRDVDFAEEAATFSRMQILTQASSFAMAQANASAQTVLSLLQG